MKAILNSAGASKDVKLVVYHNSTTGKILIVALAEVIVPLEGSMYHVTEATLKIDPADATELINALMAARAQFKRVGAGQGAEAAVAADVPHWTGGYGPLYPNNLDMPLGKQRVLDDKGTDRS